jgi:C-terminal processing protease CtpA/Prc
MRKLPVIFLAALIAACGGGGGGGGNADFTTPDTSECSNDEQKQFVLDNLYAWYLWNDLLPQDINIDDYASPEELIIRVTGEFGPQGASGPIDRFSFVRTLESEQDFLDGTLGELFGFSYRFVDEELTDFRIVRVFSGSPSDLGGLARGQRIVTVNGRSVTDIAVNEGLSSYFVNNRTVTFEIERPGVNEFTTITKAVVTIDPVPQWRLIDRGEGIAPVGYLQLDTFIDTADPRLETVFGEFRSAGVTDVIIDMRYNGGGLVRTAELVGDYLGAGIAPGELFFTQEFNAERAELNNELSFFTNSQQFETITLSRFVTIATRSTASASELVTNGIMPYADTRIVGDRTAGKPVGQIGLSFCDKIMRPVAFRYANANGNTDFFDGLPVDCAAPDDLSTEIGADDDPNVIAALSFFDTGACPAAAADGALKPAESAPVFDRDWRGTPAQQYLDAY